MRSRMSASRRRHHPLTPRRRARGGDGPRRPGIAHTNSTPGFESSPPSARNYRAYEHGHDDDARANEQFGHGTFDGHDANPSEDGSEDSIDAAMLATVPMTKGVDVKALDKLPDMMKMSVGRERLRAGAEWFRKVGLDVAIIHPRNDTSKSLWRWVKRASVA